MFLKNYFENISDQLTATIFYDKSFKGYIMAAMVHKYVAERLKPEDYIDVPCPCGCGKVHHVITKERFEEIVAKLAAERIEALN